MKTNSFIIGVIISLILIAGGTFGSVYAQEEIVLPKAGLTPESPLYFLDKLGEVIQEFLTFNPEAKARLQVAFAAERIAEIKVILKTKGVGAKGLEIAQARLGRHATKAADIVKEEVGKGKDVSALAGEIVDNFHFQRKAVKEAFKEAKDEFKTKKKELHEELLAAIEAKDIEAQERIRQELVRVEAAKDAAEAVKDAAIDALEEGKDRLHEELKDEKRREETERKIAKVEEEKQEIIDEAAEEGVTLSARAFVKIDSIIGEAQAKLEAGDFEEARQLAKQAESALEAVEDVLDGLKDTLSNKEDAKGAIQEVEEELARIKAGAQEEDVTLPVEIFASFNSLQTQAKNAFALEDYKEAERLAENAEDALEEVRKEIEKREKQKEEEQKKIEEEMKEAEKKVEEQKEAEEEQEKVEPAQEPEPQKAMVTLTQSGFSPSRLTIKVGQVVTFVNDSGRTMWVASNVHPIHTLYSGFDQLRSVRDGGTYEFAFTRKGSWGYHNHVNIGDTGTIVVE